MKEAFLDFSRFFHQDCDLYGSAWEDIIATSLNLLGKEKAKYLEFYLKNILKSNISDEILAKIWEDSRADIYFDDKKFYRTFLQAACDMAHRYVQRED